MFDSQLIKYLKGTLEICKTIISNLLESNDTPNLRLFEIIIDLYDSVMMNDKVKLESTFQAYYIHNPFHIHLPKVEDRVKVCAICEMIAFEYAKYIKDY